MGRVRLLVGERGGRFPSSNCLLVESRGGWVLVDAGCRREDLLAVRDRIMGVLMTHVHPDHITWWELFSGRPFLLPGEDAAFRSLRLLAYRYAPSVVEEWLSYAWTVFRLRSPPRGEPYDAWEELGLAGSPLGIVMVPARGHTWGHHYVLVDDHLHISDVDLTSFGPWYGHPESSIEVFLADILEAARIRAKTYTTSHRERVFSREEAVGELARYAEAVCRQAWSVARAAGSEDPVTPENLAGSGVIYRRYLPGMEAVMKYFERNIIAKLLDYMALRGDARRSARGYELASDAPHRTCEAIRGLADQVRAEV